MYFPVVLTGLVLLAGFEVSSATSPSRLEECLNSDPYEGPANPLDYISAYPRNVLMKRETKRNGRGFTVLSAMRALLRADPTSDPTPFTAIEIGTMHKPSDGLATYRIVREFQAQRARYPNSLLYSIDTNQKNLDTAEHLLRTKDPSLLDYVELVHGSVESGLSFALNKAHHVNFAFIEANMKPDLCLWVVEQVGC